MMGPHLVRHAAGDLRAYPGRFALSGFSLLIGVLAVVAIFATGEVTREVFVASAEQTTGRKVTVSGLVDLKTVAAVRAEATAGEALVAAGGAWALVAYSSGDTGLGSQRAVQDTWPLRRQTFTLVAGDLAGVRRLPLLAGRWFDSEADLPVEAVLNLQAAQQYGGVGTVLSAAAAGNQPALPVRVVGVVADGSSDANVFLPLLATLIARPLAAGGEPMQLLLHHPSASINALDQIGGQLAAAAGASIDEPFRRVDNVGVLDDQLRTQQSAFLAIAIIALAIAAVGILNIGLASVRERARELVIRRAIGATRLDILAQVVGSSLLVGVVAAAAAATAGGIGITMWAPTRIDPATAIQPPPFPVQGATWALAAALATTLVGGLIPALVAARLDMAETLRD